MRELLKSAALIAALAVALPAIAQEAAAPATGDAAPAGDPTLSLGEEVVENKVGQPYIKVTEGAWELRCVRAPEGQEEPCQLYQLLKDPQGNPVAEITIFRLEGNPQAVAGATVITPLETLLTRKLRLSVDNSAAKQYDFTWCSDVGCFARIGLTQGDVDAFKAGSTANVTINPLVSPETDVSIPVSLSGFTAGFNALIGN